MKSSDFNTDLEIIIDSILNYKLTKKEEESTSGYGYKVNTIF